MQESNQKNSTRQTLLKYAVFILSRRPYFAHTLKQKLTLYSKKKQLDQVDADINKIIEDLRESGYLKDQYLAEAYVRRQLDKGYGPRIIRYKLSILKLPVESINLSLESEADKSSQLKSARKYIAKYPQKDPRKLASSLYQRGFDSQIIQKVFDDVAFED